MEGQEYGTASSFGPATKDYYDASQWGMVPTGSKTTPSVQEVYGESPSMTPPLLTPRLRSKEEIPLLLPSPEMLYIAPLLVVLHHIPLARRALLNDSKDVVPNYGFEHEWWNGHIIDLTNEFEDINDSVHSHARMMVETQRLMAFLDGGSRRPLTQIKNLAASSPMGSIQSLKGEYPDMNPVGRFLEDLVQFGGQGSLLSQVFETAATHSVTEEVKTFSNFSTEVTVSLSPNDTLFDLVDDMVWPLPGPPQTYLSSVADVISLSLRRDDAQSGAGIKVPLTFYPDRYTEPFVPFMRMLRDRRKEYQQRLGQLNNQRFTMMNYMGKDTSKLLQTTSDYLNGLGKRGEKAEPEPSTESDNDSDSDLDEFDYTGLEAAAEDLRNAAALFAQKKQSMVDEMQLIQTEMAKESSLFKGQDDRETFGKVFPGQTYPAMRVFHLSGVILSPTEYFFCKRAEPMLIDLENDTQFIENADDANASSDSKDDFEWWRVSSPLSAASSNTPTVTRVTADDVLATAQNGSVDYGSQEVILLYATESAWNHTEHNVGLSPALQEFVDADRKALLAALREEEVANAAGAGAADQVGNSAGLASNNPFLGMMQESTVSVQSVGSSSDDGNADNSVPSLVQGDETATASAGEDIATEVIHDADADAMELEFGVRKPDENTQSS